MESENKNSQEQKKDPTLKGIVGIQNMGNTCYSNSTIQLLRSCPEWNTFCLTTNFEENININDNTIQKYPKNILLAYQDILKSLWSAYKPAYVRPLGFINEIRKAVKGTVYEMFGHPIPNDSHEFLIYLLDNFHEALNKKEDIPIKSINDELSDLEKMRIMAKNGWNSFLSKNNSEIVKLFFGMFRKTIECSKCLHRLYQWEVFNSLKIPLNKDKSFKEWIKEECEPTSLDGYKCENCKEDGFTKIYTHIWKLPENLFITLRRFNFDGRKNMTVPPNIYGDTAYLDLSYFFADESDSESKYWRYELRGISDHHGSHLGGHYTAQFKHPISGEWWLIDDESSQKLDGPLIQQSNYIYLFKMSSQIQ